MPGGYQVIAQSDFSAGTWRAGDPERMPANSFYNGENTLLDRLGMPYRRGGSSFADSAGFDVQGLTFVWDGVLTSGHTTIVASPREYAKLSGGVYTALGNLGQSHPQRAAAYNGVLYLPGGYTYDGSTVGSATQAAPFYTIAGNRLVAAVGHRVYFSKVGDPTTFNTTSDFHEIPGGAEILGLEGARDACVVFTTKGVWIITGMALNLTDEAGNVQHKLDHYSDDLQLWGDAGIAGWEGALIVPATDAVWLIRRGVTSEQPQSFQRISDSIVELYQSYTKAGYRPGLATVYRNHYLLPIFSSGRIVDLLVARLDLADRRGNVPWTQLSGEGGEMSALTVRSEAGAQPVLLGAEYAPARPGTESTWGAFNWGAATWSTASQGRVFNLGYFDPGVGNVADAGGQVPRWSLETRLVPLGAMPNLCAGARVRYTLASAPQVRPQITAEFASDTRPTGQPSWGAVTWSNFTWSTPESESYEPLGNPAPPSQDAAVAHRWRFARKRRFARLRFTCNEPTTQLQLRSLELFVRQDARL